MSPLPTRNSSPPGIRGHRPAHLLLFVWVLALPVLAEAFDQGLLWRVEARGGGADYVFGTIHSEDPQVLDFPTEVTEAFAASDRFVMELEPDLAGLSQVSSAMMFSDGGDLEQVLGGDLFRRTTAALGRRGIPAATARQMRPWAALLTLNMPEPKTGLVMDMILYLQAAEQGKAVHGLESPEEQISVFAELPMPMQVDLLRETLANEGLFEEIYQGLVEAYLARDLDRMQALYTQSMATSDEDARKLIGARLVTDRNHRMVERMLPSLEKARAFVAIGALHLPGPEGILHLLEEQGYRITRVY